MNERMAEAAVEELASKFLAGGGEMGAWMRAHDWSSSPLGSPRTWPQSLRSTIALMLNSKFPMFVAWGPDLGFLYNDAYRSVLGAKHPQALGRPFQEIWSEIWPDILPLIETALSGEATWVENLPLTMNRHGYDEQTYFTFSYSPAFDESGTVVGMFCACTETTRQVLAERALQAGVEHFQTLADEAPVILCITDPTGYCTYLNRRWYEHTGQTESEAIGLGWTEATHPDDQQMAEDAFLSANTARRSFYIEYRLRRADGVYRWSIDTAEPRFGPDGVFLGYVGSVIDIDDRRQSETHLRLLVNELNHRVKNSLATVQAIATQTFRNPDAFEHSKREFTARLIALAKAHDVLTETNWTGASLRQIVERTVDPHHGDSSHRFRIDGPHVLLTPKSALSLSMAMHELCTNASKYGALSVEHGHVDIVWSLDTAADGRRLHLVWTESGGPRVDPPQRKGFGSRLIEYGLAAELGGDVRIAYEPGGVVCVVDAPLPAV